MSENAFSIVKNLVFEGGGVKGIAYAGVVGALQSEKGIGLNFDSIDAVAGTSVGAITALTIALGCDYQQILKILIRTDLTDFLDDGQSYLSKSSLLSTSKKSWLGFSSDASLASMALIRGWGLFPGKEARIWIEELVKKETGIIHCTFKELRELREKNKKFKDLFVSGFNLNEKRHYMFSHLNYPNAVISDVVRISMGIPLVWAPHYVYVKDEGIRRKDTRALWVDGGISNNFPIDTFDNQDTNSRRQTLGFSIQKTNTLTFLKEKHGYHNNNGLDERDFSHCVPGLCREPTNSIETTIQYFKALLSGLISGNHFKVHLSGEHCDRTVYIDSVGVDTFDFHLDMDEKNKLIASGWDATCKWFGHQDKVGDCPIYFTKKTNDQINSEVEKQSDNESCVIS